MSYDIYHDLGRPMVFVGDTFHNHTLFQYFNSIRSVQQVRLEHALDQPDDWYHAHQFMAVVTNIGFKKTLRDSLSTRPIKWFSVVAKNTVMNHNIHVGFNTLINNFNVVYDDAIIGDHVTVTNFCQIGHEVTVGDLGHISPYVYLCFTDLGQGTCVGLRSSLPGKPDRPISIEPWTNILMDSRITKSLDLPGTYAGNRKIDSLTSLDVKIL